MKRNPAFALLLAFLALGAGGGAAAGSLSPPPEVAARAAVMIDAATGSILYAKNPDLPIPPASLAKLVALHVVYGEIAAGRLSKDELVEIDERDCSPNVPLGSSLMYLQPGMKVSVLDLMRGMAVVSGNDGAFALARRVSGSNEAFALLMNRAMADLGLPQLRFVEPSGLSELNTVTARDFATFSRLYMLLHPEAITELHSLRYMEFPRPEHATADYLPVGRIVQWNRNGLVRDYPGCDGLKTGYIIESGYNLAATAEREGTRVILVTLGGLGSGGLGGGDLRERDGSALLDWGFENFVTKVPEIAAFPPLRSFFGSSREVRALPAAPLAVTLPKADAAGLRVSVELDRWVDAPAAKGRRVGEVRYVTASGSVARRVDLVLATEVKRGNFLVVARDALSRFFQKLFRTGYFRA
jgi:D-alanyl-D-alanine carboxypeptidase (penicillin-binding protein 5/6)